MADPAIEDFKRSTTNHTPGADTIIEIEEYRGEIQTIAAALIEDVPPSRARSIALTHLEDAIMWGVKAYILRDKDQENG